MLRYTNRTREVALSLLGCHSSVQDVYNMIEFHRPPDSVESNEMSIKKLSEVSGVSRQHIYVVLGVLVNKGLIEVWKGKGKKRGVHRFTLLKLKSVEVVQLPGSKSTQRDAEYEASKAEFLTGLGD